MRTARENNFYFLFYMFFMLKIVIRIDVRVRDEGVEKNWEQFHAVILGLKYAWFTALLLPAVQIVIGKHHRIPRIFLHYCAKVFGRISVAVRSQNVKI